MSKKSIILNILIIMVLGLFFSTAGLAQENGNFGGNFRFAIVGEPDTIDLHLTAGTVTAIVAQHTFENLFAYNEDYQAVPQLVEDHEIKDDGKVVVLNLRKGVMFHNGKEMTSEDVVASLNRWGEFGSFGTTFYEYLEKAETDGKYTVNLYFQEVFGPWANFLARKTAGCVIYPKEVVENAGPEPIQDLIGTGPYKFKEWRSDQYILLEKFDDYVPNDREPSGYSGKRIAYFDEIMFIPVGDVSTRQNGVKSGEYDFGQLMPGDFYEELSNDPDLEIMSPPEPQINYIICNSELGILSESGPMKDPWKLRQAMLAALDNEAIMEIAIGEESLYELESSWMAPITPFYSKVGSEYYNQDNVERAQKLAEEAGYDGETIRFMTYTDNTINYTASEVAADQLKNAGFNIDLQVYDWATMLERRADPELWDMFVTGHSFYPEPILYTIMNPGYPGWWDTEKKKELLNQFITTVDQEQRVAIWNKIQALMWEEVPVMKFGDYTNYHIYSPKVENITTVSFPFFWNVWFK